MSLLKEPHPLVFPAALLSEQKLKLSVTVWFLLLPLIMIVIVKTASRCDSSLTVSSPLPPADAERGCHVLHILSAVRQRFSLNVSRAALQLVLQSLECSSDVVSTSDNHYLMF